MPTQINPRRRTLPWLPLLLLIGANTHAQGVDRVRLPDADGHASLGRADAPVTIVEFTDLQCPYCARFAEDTLPQLRARLIETGQVRFVTRDLPLDFHAHALPAAIAARCAGEQGRYWEFRAALYARQAALGNPATVDEAAAASGVDARVLGACREERGAAFTQEMLAARQAAAGIGITGTPTFVIGPTVSKGPFNGERVVGAKPYARFESAVNAALAEAAPR